MSDSVTPWTVASQVPLSLGILQAKILAWVAMPSSRGSSPPRSLALQVDSSPSEPPGKPLYKLQSDMIIITIALFYLLTLFFITTAQQDSMASSTEWT